MPAAIIAMLIFSTLTCEVLLNYSDRCTIIGKYILGWYSNHPVLDYFSITAQSIILNSLFCVIICMPSDIHMPLGLSSYWKTWDMTALSFPYINSNKVYKLYTDLFFMIKHLLHHLVQTITFSWYLRWNYDRLALWCV